MASGSKNGMPAGLWLAGAVSLLALPSAVLAFATNFEPRFAGPAAGSMQAIDSAAGATATPAHLARAIPIRSLAKGPLYPFTPAGTPNRPDRSVTVAVRVDSGAPQLISVRGIRIADSSDTQPLRIAPTAFNLCVSRGYHNFAQSLVAPPEMRKLDLPDLGKYSLATSAKAGDPARLSPHIVVDEKQAAGRAPRTFAGDGEDQVDVGGSYRLTRNLNVTAGVRYSQQDRERLHPLTDGKQDNQAVYVGTQFRF
jgi:hypothetical protein